MKNDKADQNEDFLISKLTSAVISLHQIVSNVSKKINSLEKHIRHSHADMKVANANLISHVQIMLPDELDDHESGVQFDESITLIDVQSTTANYQNKPTL